MVGALGYDAIGIGEMDLNFGLCALAKDTRKYHLPGVCANLIPRAYSGKVREKGPEYDAADKLGTAFAPYRIVTKNGIRFGFIGVMSASTKQRGGGVSSVDALTSPLGETEPAVKAVLPDVRRQSDVLVL